MKVLVTARHCDIDDEMRERAVELIERIAKLAHRAHRAEVVFDDNHKRKMVEFQLYVPRGKVHVSSAEAESFKAALDGAAAKLRNQLDKVPGPSDQRSTVGER